MIKHHYRPAAGFTLTELVIVLSVIGLILTAIWVAATSVMSANRNNQTVQDISTMASNMRSTFAAANSFTLTGDQTAAMISAGVVPSSLVNPATGNTAINAWNGAVQIFLSKPDSTHFRILYSGAPFSACFAIASQLANLGTSDAPVNLITGTGTGTVTAISSTPGSMGLSSTAINTACSTNNPTLVGFDYTIH